METEFSFSYKEPIVCTAIHNGHKVSREIEKNLAISEGERLREEDPNTAFFTEIASNRIVQYVSRFEYDINRIREKAFYLNPEDSWGLKTRKTLPDKEMIEKILQRYDLFYQNTEYYLKKMGESFKRFFVYDIHSYNHHRLGNDQPYDNPAQNPEIILGTSNMPEEWKPLVEEIKDELQSYDFMGRVLDVRINVKFPGGNFSRWIHQAFPQKVCCIALEFKKFFMDEWSGEFNPEIMNELQNALKSTKPLILSYLKKR